MTKFDKIYDIRLATIDDEIELMNFIDTYWKKGHILGHNKMLFEYEFREGNQINIVVAVKKSTNTIEGMLGFLKCSREGTPLDIWGSIWKVKDEQNNLPFLGVEIAKRIFDLTKCRFEIGCGINQKTTIPLRTKIFKDTCSKMLHFYMLNSQLTEFNIAQIKSREFECIVNETKVELIPLNNIKEFKNNFDISNYKQIPRKDAGYIEHRYYNHPIYKYQLFGIKAPNVLVEAVIVIRKVKVKNRAILRIVDYLGKHDLFALIGENLQRMLITNNYEYIDFYEYGFEKQYILEAGFIQKLENDINIIPNYFEPFLQQNIDIWVHYQKEGTLFFKADADQDRPNVE
ncbi:hypothetical protein AN641_09615 [Candidatus Epulonipiscioides gigas]|nr:hypothetical protein AN641_09615 [Epulopiscium sp. SCG-C07WGA-EpuloA2]